MSLPITKKQFDESIIPFISEYKRLPFLPEDDVSVEIEDKDGEMVSRLYRANRYINEFYETQDNMIDELFKNEVISYELVAEILGLTEAITKNTITKSTKTPDKNVRRAIHMFFEKDFYKELGKYETRYCSKCTKKKKCGKPYWVSVISCPKYRKSKRRKKKQT